ncbi:MAG: hypothetical protein HC765_04705 [Brachymonas sp.]|nr:hypothetical protein [Brachymonas sp.]
MKTIRTVASAPRSSPSSGVQSKGKSSFNPSSGHAPTTLAAQLQQVCYIF